MMNRIPKSELWLGVLAIVAPPLLAMAFCLGDASFGFDMSGGLWVVGAGFFATLGWSLQHLATLLRHQRLLVTTAVAALVVSRPIMGTAARRTTELP